MYELFPAGKTDARMLGRTLKKYGMEKKVEKTDFGTLLVHYEGSMYTDAAHQVDIQTVNHGAALARLLLCDFGTTPHLIKL